MAQWHAESWAKNFNLNPTNEFWVTGKLLPMLPGFTGSQCFWGFDAFKACTFLVHTHTDCCRVLTWWWAWDLNHHSMIAFNLELTLSEPWAVNKQVGQWTAKEEVKEIAIYSKHKAHLTLFNFKILVHTISTYRPCLEGARSLATYWHISPWL